MRYWWVLQCAFNGYLILVLTYVEDVEAHVAFSVYLAQKSLLKLWGSHEYLLYGQKEHKVTFTEYIYA